MLRQVVSSDVKVSSKKISEEQTVKSLPHYLQSLELNALSS